MKKPTYSKPPASIAKEGDRLAKFIEKPSDFSEEHWEMAKTTAIKVGACMPQQMSDSAFYFYYMGASWEEIADKLNIPIGMVLYTAVHFDWFNKKKLVNSVRAGQKVQRADAAAIDLVTDAIVATAAVYKQQIAEVIKDPTKAKHCPMIPKNYKDFLTLLQMMQSLQSDSVEKGKIGSTSVNVNIANLTSHQPGQPSATTVEVQALSSEEDNRDREELLRLLAKARGD
jgi:hypothetical protein